MIGKIPSALEIARTDYQAILWLIEDEDLDFNDYEHLEHIIMAIASKNNLKSINDLRAMHLNNEGLTKLYRRVEFDKKLHVMIEKVFKKTRDILIELTVKPTKPKKTKKQKDKELDDIFKDVPTLEPTPEWIEKLKIYQDLKENIPNFFNKIKDNPFDGYIEMATDCGVYLGVEIKNGLFIINYVGSSINVDTRALDHKTMCYLVSDDQEDEEEDVKKFKYHACDFHKYVVNNNLIWDKDQFLIPVIEVPQGLEKLLEADVYDYLKSSECNLVNVDLKNQHRPMKAEHTIHSMAAIYEISEFNEDDTNRYGGSTMLSKYFDREDQHFGIGFGTKPSKNKLYKWMQDLKAKDLHHDIQMKPILKCPIYMRFEQEKKFILENDLIENGLNKLNVNMTPEERKEAKKENAKKYYENNKEIISEKAKMYNEANNEKISLRKKKYRQENKEAIRETAKLYRENNITKVKEKEQKYYQENKEEIARKSKVFRDANKEKIAERGKLYRENNQELLKEKQELYLKNNKEKRKETCKKYYASLSAEKKAENVEKQRLKRVQKRAEAAASKN